ncbi:TBC1 domain family member 5-like, partial [Homarus americanus]
MVWDAIFSDIQPTFPLVDFFTVAMLSFIREPLLAGDYTTCLKFLMRYPAAADVQYIIQLALHLRNPKFPRPAGYSSTVPHHIPTVGGRPDVHRGPQPVAPSATFTRSSSVPRTQQHVASKKTSEQISHNTGSLRRLSSPNAFTDPLDAAVIFSNSLSNSRGEGTSGCDSSSTNSSVSNNQGTTRASKVVSGLVRLGGKLGRPRDLPVSRHLSIQSSPTPSPGTVAFVASHGQSDKSNAPTQTMKELAVVRTKSVPISARSREREQEAALGRSRSVLSSDESEEEDVSERKTSGEHESEGMSVEDLSAVCLGCAMNLSHHSAALKTRLAQLNVQPDITLRTALDGINEVGCHKVNGLFVIFLSLYI